MIKRPIKSDTKVTCCCLSVYVCFSVVVIFSLFIAATCSCQGSVRVHCRSIVGSSGVRWGWVCSIVMNFAQVSIWLKDFAVLLSISVFEKFCATLNIMVQHLEEKQNRSICSSHWGNPEVLANFARESTIILQLTAIGRENGNLKPGNLKP